MGRREFLRLMGGISVFAAIAAGSAVDALRQTAVTTTSTQNGAANQSTAATSTQAQSSNSCTVRCNKGCSYPGHCRRYTDSNNTGRCDLGECA
jgi:hypothetical protein